MVVSAVLEAIKNNEQIKACISQVHCHVKTQLIDADCSKNDA
ncbi:MAG: hypothetical protein N2738_05695 [Thermodesulfovibrionales bacterium]|nr:hypothetical protein [Thermodesulfovibrionales bacterium]